jgi:hypothetical protein
MGTYTNVQTYAFDEWCICSVNFRLTVPLETELDIGEKPAVLGTCDISRHNVYMQTNVETTFIRQTDRS